MLRACVWPQWVTLCWYCGLLCQSVGTFPAPLELPFSPLARRGTWPLSGAAQKVMCTGNMHISEESNRQLDLGCFPLFSLVNQLLVCFQRHCLY